MQQEPAISSILARILRSLATLALAAATGQPSLAQTNTAGEAPSSVDFEAEVFPLFQQRCLACHGPEQQMGGFRLDSRVTALRGGVSGRDILPGNADGSPLFQRIAGIGDLNAMPMTGERLSPDEVALVRTWIDEGARWPEGVGLSVRRVARHWAYHPPARHSPPIVRHTEAVRNPIDSFLLARLEKEGLSFVSEAPRATLIRRLSLDLRGLPPALEEVEAFLADKSPDAYGKLVDRLLKSPHFGEHWAGYWLDLARYADTNGYESDEPRTIWAYRDWVIDAFNRNMPFDRFTAEQLAGDLLENPTVDQTVATGFHRNTMLNNEAGSKDDEFYDAAVKDRVDTTTTVWLGSTVGCAQCHDHKYDPFTQDEYYRLYAIFNNTADSAIKLSEELEVFKGDKDELLRREAKVNAAKEVLDSPTAALQASQRGWEARTIQRLPAWHNAWRVLEPVSGASESDAEFEVLADGSAVVRNGKGGSDAYEVQLRAGPGPLTGLRIEALPHESLSDSGVDAPDSGAFSVTGVEAEAWTPSMLARQESALRNAPNWGNWHSIGPFRVQSKDEAFRTSFPPESNRDLSAVYEDGHLAWSERRNWTDGRVHYLQYLPDGPDLNGASYAFRTVEVREPTSVVVSLGSHKGLKVWLNSDLVLSTDPTRDIAPDQEKLRLDLRPGTNEILLKLTNDLGTYGFYFQPYFAAEGEARLRFARATADHGTWTPVELTAVLDGRSETAWEHVAGPVRDGANPVAVMRLSHPVHLPDESRLKLRLIHGTSDEAKALPRRFRVSATSLGTEQLNALQSTPGRVRQTLAAGPSGRSASESERLSAHFRSIAPELESHRRRYAELQADLEAFRKAQTTKTLVMRELPEPRETRVQKRGNFLDLGERVEPGGGRPCWIPWSPKRSRTGWS